MGHDRDVVVVGAGIVGLATAYQLLRQRPGLRLAVIDKEDRVAAHQSGHNSGVIHSGLYYTPGSFKATLCREGRLEMESFADEHSIRRETCGKVIVAVRANELDRLRALRARGEANGLQGLAEIGPEELREREPGARGLRALVVPETGIIDFGAVTRALAGEVAARGGEVLLGRQVTALVPDGGAQRVVTGVDEVRARLVVSCAGLQADRVGGGPGHEREPGSAVDRVVPFRGAYFRLRPEAHRLVSGLLYPVPDPSLPFLGVHFTRRIDGEVWAGPSAVLALAREGYGRGAVDGRDLLATASFAGFWRMARRHWRFGAAEMARDWYKPAVVRELRRYVPAITSADLLPGPTGIRAQLVGRDGTLMDDFCFRASPGVLRVLNAPSPAATASLAIGRHIAARALAAV